MPQMRILIAASDERRSAVARALGIHAARPRVEVGAAATRDPLFRELASRSWQWLLIDRGFEKGGIASILAAASELIRDVRVLPMEPDEAPDAIAARVLNDLSVRRPLLRTRQQRTDDGTVLVACDTLDELISLDGRRPRTGLLSCVAVHAPSAASSLAVTLRQALADGGVACRWRGLEVVLRRAASPGEAFTWAEGLCSRLPSASLGVTWGPAAELSEAALNQADHALMLALARGPGSVCTWQTVAALQIAGRVGEQAEDPRERREALLSELGPALGPAQRHHLTSHSEEVAATAYNLAQLLRMSPAECERVRLAALFHDIGKMIIPDDLLAKPGPLSPLQRRVMDRHTAEGAHLCTALRLDPDIARIVAHHHTRFDSSEPAPDAARIVAVADAMITMTSTRPYSPARSFSYALSELRRCRGTVFDPRAVVAAHILGASSMAAAA